MLALSLWLFLIVRVGETVSLLSPKGVNYEGELEG